MTRSFARASGQANSARYAAWGFVRQGSRASHVRERRRTRRNAATTCECAGRRCADANLRSLAHAGEREGRSSGSRRPGQSVIDTREPRLVGEHHLIAEGARHARCSALQVHRLHRFSVDRERRARDGQSELPTPSSAPRIPRSESAPRGEMRDHRRRDGRAQTRSRQPLHLRPRHARR